jgi:hypothetical protein
MHTARSDATATLLKNGKVLIAGGDTGSGGSGVDTYATAELYDPATGTFSPTGSMHAARSAATATLLANGKVLIAGGSGCPNPKDCVAGPSNNSEPLASAELYDPHTGQFTITGSMTLPNENAAATLLADGRVLIASGVDLYSPDSGKFVSGGNEANIIGGVAATFLPKSGKVLVTGDSSNGFLAQLYDEHSRKFTTISLALPAGTPTAHYEGSTVARSGYLVSATLLKDGRVLLFDSGYLETYDPTSGKCADAGFISPAGQWFPTATPLSDGRVLFAGGQIGSPGPSHFVRTNAVVLYDPNGGTVRTGSMVAAREDQTATLLPDGGVLISGGVDGNNSALASAELFKP